MESQMKYSMDGTQGKNTSGAGLSLRQQLPSFILRFVAIVLTLVAAIVMATDKETQTVYIQIVPTLPVLAVMNTAKSHYSSAFVFFVVANTIGVVYSILSLAIAIANKGRRNTLSVLLIIGDVVVMAILFAGNGAAAAIGVVGERGNSHVMWNKVCNIYTKFCNSLIMAVLISLLGCVVYFMLVLFAVIGLHRKSQ